MGKFSRCPIYDIFSYFSQKIVFDISCKLSPVETLCMKFSQSLNCFLRKIKTFQNVFLCYFYPPCLLKHYSLDVKGVKKNMQMTIRNMFIFTSKVLPGLCPVSECWWRFRFTPKPFHPLDVLPQDVSPWSFCPLVVSLPKLFRPLKLK